MSDQTPATAIPEVPGTPPTEQPADPFAGFKTEAFDAGEPVEVEQPATETPPAEPAEPTEPKEGEAEEEAPPAEKPAAPKKQTAQERIDELTRARREAEREAADLRRRLEALEARAPREAPTEKPEESPKDDATGPPKPEDFEFGELDSRYIAAVVDYQTERRFEEFRQRDAQERQQAEARAKFAQQIELGRKKYDDFEEKVVRGAQEGAWPLSETLGVLLVGSEVGEDIAYELASNPGEAERVFRLPATEQARYFGRLEAKFSAARAAATGGNAPAETPATTRAPQAPPPVTPGRGAGGQFQATAKSDDFAAFEAAAMKSS